MVLCLLNQFLRASLVWINTKMEIRFRGLRGNGVDIDGFAMNLPLSESTVTLFLMHQFEFVFLFCRWVQWCLLCSKMVEWWMFPADSIRPNSMPWYCCCIYWFANLLVHQHRNIRAKIQRTKKHCINQFAMETFSRSTVFEMWKWKKIFLYSLGILWNLKCQKFPFRTKEKKKSN